MATAGRRAAQKKYNAKPEQVKRRTARNKARRQMISEGRARKGDGKDVGHQDGNPRNNKRSNLKMQSKASNRSLKRKKDGSKRKQNGK